MKKMISLLLALTMLCSMLPMSALAAYDTSKPYCQRDDHAKTDGMNHERPQSCWTKGHFNCDGKEHVAASAALKAILPARAIMLRLPAALRITV